MEIMVAIELTCAVSPQAVSETIALLEEVAAAYRHIARDPHLILALAAMLRATQQSGHILIHVDPFPKERILQPGPERRN